MEGSQRGSASHLRGSCVGVVLPRLPWRRFTTIWIRSSLKLIGHPPPFFGGVTFQCPLPMLIAFRQPAPRSPASGSAAARILSRLPSMQQVPGEHRWWRTEPPHHQKKKLLTAQRVFFSDCLINMWLRVKPQRWMDWLIKGGVRGVFHQSRPAAECAFPLWTRLTCWGQIGGDSSCPHFSPNCGDEEEQPSAQMTGEPAAHSPRTPNHSTVALTNVLSFSPSQGSEHEHWSTSENISVCWGRDYRCFSVTVTRRPEWLQWSR